MILTPAEQLFVDRSLRNLTQHQAARAWKTTFWTYRSWESNPNLVPDGVREALRYVDKHEIPRAVTFAVKRRRKGMTQRELANEIGVSRQWVNRMERGLEDDSQLDDFWSDEQ